MKKITGFYLASCPYCRNARAAWKELVKEDPAYAAITVQWHEETQEPEAVAGHSYYYVPSLFLGKKKLYEAQPGQTYEEIKQHVKSAADYVLQHD